MLTISQHFVLKNVSELNERVFKIFRQNFLIK